MSELSAKGFERFEGIKHIHEDGSEYWFARELSAALDYNEWRYFTKVIDKARLACKNSGFSIDDHFVELNKMVEIGDKIKRSISDFELSRYACYLIIQNGDSSKAAVAHGQTYFAIISKVVFENMKAKRFKIALSFPGEYRCLVRDIAQRLSKTYSEESILFDEFHSAEFAMPNLDIHLQRLYGNESELIVVFVCKEYNDKIWCGIEWRSIRNLMNNKIENNRIMFIKLGEGRVEGVFGSTDGYLDATMMGIPELVDSIQKRHLLVS